LLAHSRVVDAFLGKASRSLLPNWGLAIITRARDRIPRACIHGKVINDDVRCSVLQRQTALDILDFFSYCTTKISVESSSAGGYILQAWKFPEYVVPDLNDFKVGR